MICFYLELNISIIWKFMGSTIFKVCKLLHFQTSLPLLSSLLFMSLSKHVFRFYLSSSHLLTFYYNFRCLESSLWQRVNCNWITREWSQGNMSKTKGSMTYLERMYWEQKCLLSNFYSEVLNPVSQNMILFGDTDCKEVTKLKSCCSAAKSCPTP